MCGTVVMWSRLSLLCQETRKAVVDLQKNVFYVERGCIRLQIVAQCVIRVCSLSLEPSGRQTASLSYWSVGGCSLQSVISVWNWDGTSHQLWWTDTLPRVQWLFCRQFERGLVVSVTPKSSLMYSHQSWPQNRHSANSHSAQAQITHILHIKNTWWPTRMESNDFLRNRYL